MENKKFWEKVKKTDNCWFWIGGKGKNGYGSFWDKKTKSAHRFSWELHNGLITNDLCVLHTCDNPLCVNPNHLFLGTRLDNMRDRDTKQRQARGENNGRHKLLESDIKLIRNSNLSISKLAKQFSVSKFTINAVKQKKYWKSV